MKHLIYSLGMLALVLKGDALLAQNQGFAWFHDGHIARNGLIFSIDWTQDNLFNILDEGKPLLYQYFDPTDTVLWNYHNTQVMQSLYYLHGPDGDNTIKVLNGSFDIEASLGDGPDALGDWITGTPYPTVDVDCFWHQLNSLMPSRLFAVCPDRKMIEVGIVDGDSLYSAAMRCETLVEANDAQIIFSDMDTTASCFGSTRFVNAYLSNIGTAPLTSAEIVVAIDGNEVLSQMWSGYLAPLYNDTIPIGNIQTSGDPSLVQVYVRQPNGVEDEDHSNDTLNIPLVSPVMWDDDKMIVEIETGQSAGHLYWELTNESGNIIHSRGNSYVGLHEIGVATGAGQYYPNSYVLDTFDLSAYPNQCIKLRLVSGYGCGIDCADVPTDNYIRFKKGDEVIYEFTQFGWKKYGKIYTTFQAESLTASYAITHETDGQANGSIAVTASGGYPPYEYSKDCGVNFGTNTTFENLSQGWYCMRTRDGVGQVRQDSVFVDNIVGAHEVAIREVALRPNPARDVLQVSITANQNTMAALSVVNIVGQVVWQQEVSLVNGQQAVAVPTSNLTEGVYWLVVHDSLQTVYQRFVVLR